MTSHVLAQIGVLLLRRWARRLGADEQERAKYALAAVEMATRALVWRVKTPATGLVLSGSPGGTGVQD